MWRRWVEMDENKIVSWKILSLHVISWKYNFSNSELSAIGPWWWITTPFLSVMCDWGGHKLIGMGNRIIVWDKPKIVCASYATRWWWCRWLEVVVFRRTRHLWWMRPLSLLRSIQMTWPSFCRTWCMSSMWCWVCSRLSSSWKDWGSHCASMLGIYTNNWLPNGAVWSIRNTELWWEIT